MASPAVTIGRLVSIGAGGVVSTGGFLGSISGDQIPMFASLMTGTRGGHHGLIANRYWMRGQKRIQPLAMGVSGDLEGVQGASLRRPSQSLFRLFGDSDHWTVALGTAPCLEVETCTASGRALLLTNGEECLRNRLLQRFLRRRNGVPARAVAIGKTA